MEYKNGKISMERGSCMGWEEQVERNLKAMEYEEQGETEKAIRLYEKNVSEEFDGTHPYQRLCDLYFNLDKTEDMLRILEKAIRVFEGAASGDCTDKQNQLMRFKQAYMNMTELFKAD